MKYYLYNPLSNNGLKPQINPSLKLLDATKTDYEQFFSDLKPEDEVVLIGGDGTINHLVNHYDCSKLKNNVYLFPNGTGNDFINDINEKPGKEILLNKYLVNLPTVKVKDIEKKFINNMGFGIDGYCCETADKIRERSPDKKISYPLIAIMGLLFHFRPCHASVEVDGEKFEFDNVWLAPTMKGRFYGGGLMIAPDQDRNSDTLSVVLYMTKSKLKALMVFPSIFQGKHVEKKDMVKVIKGRKVHVKFSRPCPAQIDGDTLLDVREYSVEI